MHPQSNASPDTKNLILALVAATSIMFAWQYFYEAPRQKALQQAQIVEKAKAEETAAAQASLAAPHIPQVEDATAAAPRIAINTPNLHGSISLIGARLDELTLARYRETLAEEAPEVKLLTRANTADAYFLELGVLGQNLALPDATTRWQSSDTELAVDKPVTLRWDNGEGLSFKRTIAIDERYLFTITTTVKNASGRDVTLYPYGLISRNKAVADETKEMFMHEGPIGVAGGVLHDANYKAMREDGPQKFADTTGWIGMADKYWLTAIIPAEDQKFDAEYKHFKRGEADAYQVDLRGKATPLVAGGEVTLTTRVFAGAKEVSVLDHYRDQLGIPLFDRAVDFGSLYFLTRPMFALLSYFNSIVGNFGIAIMLLTLVIKLLLYPLAHKSMVAMARMKQLMPKMQEIREHHSNDKMRMNQEVMALYKREKVNPAAGCLPILLQIPVFFALYRVLLVTLEMRHAPFYAWVKDLSAIDPTNIFTLFGLLPWDAPSFLHIGVLPMVMCVTMVIQQRLNPKPADEIQAAMMAWMPYVFLFMFAGFPAGLVLYWVVNNTLTIAQQLYINTHLTKKGLR